MRERVFENEKSRTEKFLVLEKFENPRSREVFYIYIYYISDVEMSEKSRSALYIYVSLLDFSDIYSTSRNEYDSR